MTLYEGIIRTNIRIYTETSCGHCPLQNNCIEDKCAIYRIEKAVVKEIKESEELTDDRTSKG